MTITLKEFEDAQGSKAQAAITVGVGATTFWRWRNRITRPKGNNARRLRELGVRW